MRLRFILAAWLGRGEPPYRLSLDSKSILARRIGRGAMRPVHNAGSEADQDERSS